MAFLKRPIGSSAGPKVLWKALCAVVATGLALGSLSPARYRTQLLLCGDSLVAQNGPAAAAAANDTAAQAGAAAAAAGSAAAGLQPAQQPADAAREAADPMQEAYARLQTAPADVTPDAALAAQFAAAPWLLPPNCTALPYAGVHDFDALMALRARPAAGYDKAIALIPFDSDTQGRVLLLLNTIYTMVRFAGVDNFLLWVWTDNTLTDCATMNLPCADARPHLLEPQGKGRDVKVVMWLKPVLMLRALKAGYLSMMLDGDLGVSSKPLWDVLTQLALRSEADAVFQEEGPVNTGSFLVLTTPKGMQGMEMWLGGAAAALPDDVSRTKSDQVRLIELHEQGAFLACCNAGDCRDKLAHQNGTGRPLWRTWNRWNKAIDDRDCRLGGDWHAAAVDPCDSTILFVHPLCVSVGDKVGVIQRAGLWLLDSAKPPEGCWKGQRQGTKAVLPICPPQAWRQPAVERRLRDCGGRSLDDLLAYLGAHHAPPPPPPLGR